MGSPPRNVAVVRLSAFGDVVFALPAAAALRDAFPEARLSWIVEDRFAPLLRAVPDVDDVVPLPLRAWRRAGGSPAARAAALFALCASLRDLRRRRFDAVCDLQGNLKSGIVARLTGAPLRVGPARGETREPGWFFANRRVALGAAPLHQIERGVRTAAALGFAPTYRRPRIGLPTASLAVADAFVDALPPGGPLVVLHPGTSAFMPHKRWPAGRYAELARRLRDAVGARVVVSWGPDDRAFLPELVAAADGAAVLAPDLPDPLALGALLRRAALVVGGDTGPVHWADALGAPVVALFGPTDPDLYGPFRRPERALSARVACAPCRFRGCPERLCLDALSVDAALAACLAALERPVV
jgi:lipopolysaccharide heptosyltransferase I